MDTYTLTLLAWFYGISYAEVKARDWTEEQIAEAQQYVEENHRDPIYEMGC